MSCPVTADLNRHLDQIDGEERYAAMIEAKVKELLEDDCNPLSRENFDTAMVENFPNVEFLAGLLRDKKYELAGRLLEHESIAYWTREAHRRVEKSL